MMFFKYQSKNSALIFVRERKYLQRKQNPTFCVDSRNKAFCILLLICSEYRDKIPFVKILDKVEISEVVSGLKRGVHIKFTDR